MNGGAAAPQSPRRWRIGLLVGGCLLLLLGANAHMLYVALTSQPTCVAHARAGDGTAKPGQFSAAKSAC